MRVSLLSYLLAFPLLAGNPPPPVDSTRPFLESLRTSGRATFTDYDYPFLISETALAVSASYAETEAQLRRHLAVTSLPYRGHFNRTGIDVAKLGKEGLNLPKSTLRGRELESIESCTTKKCQVKLTEREAAEIESAPVKAKVDAFRSIVLERVQKFVLDRELRGYEDRASDRLYIGRMLGILPFMKMRYPAATEFLGNGFWNKQPPPASLVTSFLGTELVTIGSDRLQPILRVGETFEFQEKDSLLWVEVPIYTNHYLDASLRVYELLPLKDRVVVVITDVMEIDELKKSVFIRALYKGKMEDAVGEAESAELQAFQDRGA